MIEADPLSMILIANDATQTVLQAGPPSGLPSQVPDFVSNILDAVRNFTGEGGLGETIRGLTPGGSEIADGVGNGASVGGKTPLELDRSRDP